jgi:hypothetical protein
VRPAADIVREMAADAARILNRAQAPLDDMGAGASAHM